jgi:FixJ family two-component response regulator
MERTMRRRVHKMNKPIENHFLYTDKLLSKTVAQRQIKKLSARHYQVIELLLAGQRPRDIAKKMQFGKQWLSVIMNSPEFRHELQTRLSERLQEFERMRAERDVDELERELLFKINLADAAAEAAGYAQCAKPSG